jgi:hypothetical protein
MQLYVLEQEQPATGDVMDIEGIDGISLGDTAA